MRDNIAQMSPTTSVSSVVLSSNVEIPGLGRLHLGLKRLDWQMARNVCCLMPCAISGFCGTLYLLFIILSHLREKQPSLSKCPSHKFFLFFSLSISFNVPLNLPLIDCLSVSLFPLLACSFSFCFLPSCGRV